MRHPEAAVADANAFGVAGGFDLTQLALGLQIAASPNCGPRRGGVLPDMVVLHYTAMATAKAAIARMCDPQSEVSAHYLIDRKGGLVRLVEEAQRAWHAGAGAWGGCSDVNSRSIGIELDNTGGHPFPEPQMAALEALLADIMRRRAIAPARIIAHSDMAPERKADPGARFDWRRLAIGGLSVWPGRETDPQGGGAQAFADAAARFGYSADFAPDAVLSAFRLRFRPWQTGPLCAGDVADMMDLARRFPVDRTADSA